MHVYMSNNAFTMFFGRLERKTENMLEKHGTQYRSVTSQHLSLAGLEFFDLALGTKKLVVSY